MNVPQPPQTARGATAPLLQRYVQARDVDPWAARTREAAVEFERQQADELATKRQKNAQYRHGLEAQIERAREERERQRSAAHALATAERESSLLFRLDTEATRERMREDHRHHNVEMIQQLHESLESHRRQREREDAIAYRMKEEAEAALRAEKEERIAKKQKYREVANETMRANAILKQQHRALRQKEAVEDIEIMAKAAEREELAQRRRQQDLERRMLPRLTGAGFAQAADPFETDKYKKFFAAHERTTSTATSPDSSPRSARGTLPVAALRTQLLSQMGDRQLRAASQREAENAERRMIDRDVSEFQAMETQRAILAKRRQQEYADTLKRQLTASYQRDQDRLSRGLV